MICGAQLASDRPEDAGAIGSALMGDQTAALRSKSDRTASVRRISFAVRT